MHTYYVGRYIIIQLRDLSNPTVDSKLGRRIAVMLNIIRDWKFVNDKDFENHRIHNK